MNDFNDFDHSEKFFLTWTIIFFSTVLNLFINSLIAMQKGKIIKLFSLYIFILLINEVFINMRLKIVLGI